MNKGEKARLDLVIDKLRQRALDAQETALKLLFRGDCGASSLERGYSDGLREAVHTLEDFRLEMCREGMTVSEWSIDAAEKEIERLRER